MNWLAVLLGSVSHANWPDEETVIRLFTLQDYNTRVVLLGVTALGLASGIIGSFMILRKRALLSDSIAHATLPGICITFLILSAMDINSKNFFFLLFGAGLSGIISILCVQFLRAYTKLKEDAVLGIILSSFFGFGVVLMGFVQQHPKGNAAGIDGYIFGKTASIQAHDAQMLMINAILICIMSLLLFKEFRLICFDSCFAATQGWPVLKLDILLMGLVVIVTVIGLQAVGIVLVISLLIIPPAAARFWTDRLFYQVLIAGVLGAASGFFGAAITALFERLPAGATIVLVSATCFFVSMVLGSKRGMLMKFLKKRELDHQVLEQNLLRAFYELHEDDEGNLIPNKGARLNDLLIMRSWLENEVQAGIRILTRKGLVTKDANHNFVLTELGGIHATRIVRNHRLWEIYLITHADVATGRVDRVTDKIEHILGDKLVARLEHIVAEDYPHLHVPASPHPISGGKI